jgi:hypothetical protein
MTKFIGDACSDKSNVSVTLDPDVFEYDSSTHQSELSVELVRTDGLLLKFPQLLSFGKAQAQLLLHLSYDSKYYLYAVTGLEGEISGVGSDGKLHNVQYTLSKGSMVCRVSIPE